MTTKQKPSLIAYAVSGEGDKAFWTRIGTAWPHKSGEGFSIDLTAFPIGGRIVLMPPKASQNSDDGDAS